MDNHANRQSRTSQLSLPYRNENHMAQSETLFHCSLRNLTGTKITNFIRTNCLYISPSTVKHICRMSNNSYELGQNHRVDNYWHIKNPQRRHTASKPPIMRHEDGKVSICFLSCFLSLPQVKTNHLPPYLFLVLPPSNLVLSF